MCGIAGKIYFDSKIPVQESLIREMCDTIVHRGPDDSGVYADRHFGFGMRRLSIIDVAAGHQPMFSEDGKVAVVFNGEIYNFPEVRAVLEGKGHIFHTHSDTEVILNGYLEWGEGFVAHLNGMFAIALWDTRAEDLLLLYRDRIGVKPLYYYQDERQLLFGSEIKAILADPSVPRRLDYDGLALYLALGYVPSPYSMVRGIRKLTPGHYLAFRAGQVTIRPYWALRFAPENKSPEAFREEFLALFDDAVRMRMISDVPIGAFLSGGIDSSAVVAFMAKHSKQPVKTFSIGMREGGAHDETRYALEIADLFKTDHTVFKVGSEIVGMMDLYLTHFDEPFADYAAFPTYVVSQLAREQVTVVLTGDAGDELFAGYERYYNEKLADYYRKVPGFFRKRILSPGFRFLASLMPVNSEFRHLLDGIVVRSNEANLPAGKRYINRFNIFNKRDRQLLVPDNCQAVDVNAFLARYWLAGGDDLSNRLNVDFHTSLPEDMFTKVDRMTMAVSLEARSPFADYRIAEFAARLPSDIKFRGFQLKAFLKYAFKGLLPHHILHRRKHGFSTPLDKWLRNDLFDLVQSTLGEERLTRQGLLNVSEVRSLVEAHYSNKANNGLKIFMLMTLSLWMEKYGIQR